MRAAGLAVAILALLGGAGPAPADAPPRLEVTLDTTSITVGDPVTATVRLRLGAAAAGAPAAIVGAAGTWGGAAVLEGPSPVPGAADGERVWTLRLTSFRPGRVELPPLEARLGDDPPRVVRSATPPALEVVSVLPAAGDGEPRPEPAAPPRALPLPAALGWTLAALAAALAATAFALARRAPAAEAAPPPPPPLEELERALAGIPLAEPGAGHVALSSSVRRYLGRRLEFPALESTTTEVARRLAARGLDAALARRARRLLADCDAVKFALRETSATELAARLEEGRGLAAGVEAATAPPAAEGTRA